MRFSVIIYVLVLVAALIIWIAGAPAVTVVGCVGALAIAGLLQGAGQ